MAAKSLNRFTLTFPQSPIAGTLDALLTTQAREFALSVPTVSDTTRTLTLVFVETSDDEIAAYVGDTQTSQFAVARTGVLTLYDRDNAVIEAIPLNQLTGVSAEMFITASLSVVMYRCVYTFLI